MKQRAKVAAFHDRESAEELVRHLNDCGIESRIHDESKLVRYWFLTRPLASIHVEVNQPDFAEADKSIQQLDKEHGVLKKAARCPECGSARVQYPQITRKFFMPFLEALLMAVKILPREYYCWNCHYTWPPYPPAKRPKEDALGWPIREKNKRGVKT